MSKFKELETKLGYTFKNRKHLQIALTHPSVGQEQRNVQHNQRLEFLGDAVLQLVLSHHLFERHPAFGEGLLTKARARLVNRRTLAELGRQLALGRFLVLSRGEEAQGGRDRASILADAFEAVIGAIYIDGGFAAARDFIMRCFAPYMAQLESSTVSWNPKGELQELLQSMSQEPPQYRLVSVEGPDHDRVFECVVVHRGVPLATGKGKSKKAAEADAATAALVKLRAQLGGVVTTPARPKQDEQQASETPA